MPPTRASPSFKPTAAVVKPLKDFGEPYRQLYYARYMPMFKNPYTTQDSNAKPKDPRPPPLSLRDLECQAVLGKGQSQVLLVKNTRRVHPLDTSSELALKAVRRKAVRASAIYRDSNPLPDDDDHFSRRRRKDEIERHHSDVNQERKILALLEWSPFVTGLIDCFDDSQALYMGLEYIPGGTLRGLLRHTKAVNLETTKFFIANILCGLEHLRKHGIAHRDIKPDNILLGQDGYLVLTDFGSAARCDDRSASWKDVGTPWYRAPEMFLDSQYDPQDAPYAIDIWSIGCVLYELLTGRLVFCESGVIQTYAASLKGIRWPPGRKEDADGRKLIKRMLIVDSPSDRIGAEDIDEIFKHPFLKSIDKTHISTKTLIAPIVPPQFYDNAKGYRREPLPKQSHFPGISIQRVPILLANDDRLPKRPLRA